MLSWVELCQAMCTHPSAVVTQFPILQPAQLDKFLTCSVFNSSTKIRRELVANSIQTAATVESRRRQRCVLGHYRSLQWQTQVSWGKYNHTCISAANRRQERVVEVSWKWKFDADVCGSRLVVNHHAVPCTQPQDTRSISPLYHHNRLNNNNNNNNNNNTLAYLILVFSF